ncbi:LysM peptidoglycan-binding domain-containing protein, partial [Staphylococcus epidermidis]|uniref:LysM peptidoglycan-binding domain-containing protein n=1 Tax=Staphylococcus epidermidis TaxID=1282 RepID=UPI00119F167C
MTPIIPTTPLTPFPSTHPQPPTTHTVKTTQSLSSISHKYPITIPKLKSLNPFTSNLIFPNQVFKLAASSSTPTS